MTNLLEKSNTPFRPVDEKPTGIDKKWLNNNSFDRNWAIFGSCLSEIKFQTDLKNAFGTILNSNKPIWIKTILILMPILELNLCGIMKFREQCYNTKVNKSLISVWKNSSNFCFIRIKYSSLNLIWIWCQVCKSVV